MVHLKKTLFQNYERGTEIESELGRIPVRIFDNLALSLQPKERIASIEYLHLSSRICTKLSYRDATETINLFLHRSSQESVKLKTLSDCMDRTGNKISEALEETAERILEMHGFDSESGLVRENVTISGNITGCCIPEKTASITQAVNNVIETVNENRDEKIPFTAEELNIEFDPLESVYVSVDDIGVKHQKEQRCPGCEKTAKYVENTVVHIQYGEEVYALTSSSMKNAMKCTLAFLIFNGLLKKRLVFFTDGARNIKNSIEELFSFRPYTVILDWFHLKKKCQELLSMALKGKKERNNTLEKLLRILWVGDVGSAVNYLNSLPASVIKNKKWLEEQTAYLKRKEENITCYAVRAGLSLRNSSNPVEKENDILVAQRQKHNGMSWSKHGSNSLAAIEMVFQNGYEDLWFRKGQISFVMPKKKKDMFDMCA